MRTLLSKSPILPAILLAALALAWPAPSHSQSASQLWKAAFDGDLATVKSCLDHGVDVNSRGQGGMSPLVVASRNGHLDVVKYLVEHGANVNDADNMLRKSPLLAASFSRRQDVVEYLLGKGANINAQAHNGFTPLNDAAAIGDFGIVKYLVEHGADPQIKDLAGRTPLQNAAQRLARYSSLSNRFPNRGSAEDFKNIVDYLKQHGG